MYTARRLVLLYISTSIIKLFQRVFDLLSGHETSALSLPNITEGDNAKSKKGRVVILVCDILFLGRRLVLVYISTKSHQSIPKGI